MAFHSQTNSLDYPWHEAPEPGRVTEVQAGVFWIRMPLPFALDHINLWIVEEDDGWTLIDTGMDTPETQNIWVQLFAGHFSGKPAKRVICTHHHPDHMGLSGWLTDRYGIPLYTTQREWEAFHVWERLDQTSLVDMMRRFYMSGDVPEQRRESDLRRRTSFRTTVRLKPHGFSAISDGSAFLAGGREWQVCVGTGHSPELAALFSPGAGLLISGDQILPRISPNVSVMPFDLDANPLQDFLASLDKFRQLPNSVLVLPSHKLPFFGLHQRITELRDHHDDRLDDTVRACSRPVTASDVVSVLFPRALNDHQYFFALGETFAHLNYLWHRGDLQRDISHDGVLWFAAR